MRAPADGGDPRGWLAREPMHANQVRAVAAATALNALDGFDVLSVSFAAPGLSRDWRIGPAALGVVLSSELVGMAAGALLLGAVADRVGRRTTILACLTLMWLGMLAAALAQGVAMLSAIRLVTGLGIGGMLAATNAMVAECANDRRRDLCVAVMAGGYPLGAVVGGGAAALILARTGSWRPIFLLGAAASAAFLPMAGWALRETVPFLCTSRSPHALMRLNAVLASYGRAPVASLPSAASPRGAIAGSEPGRPNLERTARLAACYFLHIATFYFLMKWTPKIVHDLGFSPPQAAGVLVWTNVGGVLGCATLSLLSGALRVRVLVAVAMLAGCCAVAGLGIAPASLGALSAVAAAAGFFTNGATAGLYATVAQAFPASSRAGGTGLVIGVGRGGAAAGPALAGVLFQAGWHLPAVAAALAAGSFLAALTLLAPGGAEPEATA